VRGVIYVLCMCVCVCVCVCVHVQFSVVHFTVDAVNRHLMVRRILRL